MFIRRRIVYGMFAFLISTQIWAQDAKTDTKTETKKEESVKKIYKNTKHEENININYNTKPDLITPPTRYFCAKTEEGCTKACEKWLSQQKKNLGKNFRTGDCTGPVYLYGKEEHKCMAYLCSGDISFINK